MTWILIIPAILVALCFLGVASLWILVVMLCFIDVRKARGQALTKKPNHHQATEAYRVLD